MPAAKGSARLVHIWLTCSKSFALMARYIVHFSDWVGISPISSRNPIMVRYTMSWVFLVFIPRIIHLPISRLSLMAPVQVSQL